MHNWEGFPSKLYILEGRLVINYVTMTFNDCFSVLFNVGFYYFFGVILGNPPYSIMIWMHVLSTKVFSPFVCQIDADDGIVVMLQKHMRFEYHHQKVCISWIAKLDLIFSFLPHLLD